MSATQHSLWEIKILSEAVVGSWLGSRMYCTETFNVYAVVAPSIEQPIKFFQVKLETDTIYFKDKRD